MNLEKVKVFIVANFFLLISKNASLITYSTGYIQTKIINGYGSEFQHLYFSFASIGGLLYD